MSRIMRINPIAFSVKNLRHGIARNEQIRLIFKPLIVLSVKRVSKSKNHDFKFSINIFIVSYLQNCRHS